MINQGMVDDLLQENSELHKLVHLTRMQTIGVLMAFIHMSADHSDLPASWLLAYVVNDDRDVLNCETTEEWPEGYELQVQLFCDMMSYYNDNSSLSPPVRDIVKSMIQWPYPNKPSNVLH